MDKLVMTVLAKAKVTYSKIDTRKADFRNLNLELRDAKNKLSSLMVEGTQAKTVK